MAKAAECAWPRPVRDAHGRGPAAHVARQTGLLRAPHAPSVPQPRVRCPGKLPEGREVVPRGAAGRPVQLRGKRGSCRLPASLLSGGAAAAPSGGSACPNKPALLLPPAAPHLHLDLEHPFLRVVALHVLPACFTWGAPKNKKRPSGSPLLLPLLWVQAFQALVGGHKLSNAEELELVGSLDIPPQQVRALVVRARTGRRRGGTRARC